MKWSREFRLASLETAADLVSMKFRTITATTWTRTKRLVHFSSYPSTMPVLFPFGLIEVLLEIRS